MAEGFQVLLKLLLTSKEGGSVRFLKNLTFKMPPEREVFLWEDIELNN